MIGAVQAERQAIERTYEDAVSFLATEEKPLGHMNTNIAKPLWSKLPCALSWDLPWGGDRSKQTMAQQDIRHDAVLYLPPEYLIRPGYTAQVSSMERIYDFLVVGQPAVYPTHQEVRMKGRRLA